MTLKKKYILPVLLLVQVLVLKIASLFPEFVERYYSNGIYPVISKTLRVGFGFFPFSVGDILYGIVLFFCFRWLWKIRKNWKQHWKDNILKILSFISVFYFLFHFLWATNYHRIPLYQKLGIEKEYSLEQLEDFTTRLIEKTNTIHKSITGNDTLKVVNPYSSKEIYEKSINGYENLSRKLLFFRYEKPSIKSSLISTPLSYMGFGGYLNPFTNEAQVNSCIPKYNFPTTTLHEMAHQIGYASESEANFIGFLASVHSSDVYFQYSGYSFALKYCLRNLERFEEGKSETFIAGINPGILKNFDESRQFHEKYKNIAEPFFEKFYDYFLKFNKQEDGLEGYNKFVGLMVNYEESL